MLRHLLKLPIPSLKCANTLHDYMLVSAHCNYVGKKLHSFIDHNKGEIALILHNALERTTICHLPPPFDGDKFQLSLLSFSLI